MKKRIIQLLQTKNLTIAAYESLTGGLFSNTLTNVPGASQVFLGSLVTYHNQVKTVVGHVDPTIIANYGVVSSQTARAMANACADLFQSDLAVSFTGNAGPKTLDHLLVGRIYLAIRYQNKVTIYQISLNPFWSRQHIKRYAVKIMLQKIYAIIQESNKENK